MNYFLAGIFFSGKRRFRSVAIALAFALLASAHAQQCVTPPSGIVGWWSAENNALDNLGVNNGVLSGTAGYAPGVVGQAFNFVNAGDQATFPTTGFPVGTSDRSMECWVYVASFLTGTEVVFAGYGSFGTDGAIYYLGATPAQQIFFSQWGQSLSGPIINSNQWYHIAVTSVGNNLTLYLDGTNVASGSLPFSTPPGTTLYLGEITAPFTQRQLIGEVDELAIYNRALASNEIQAIYNAGSAGKCPFPFAIASQPASETVPVGLNASFTAGAMGPQPLSYQWYFGGNNISGATTPSLLLTNVQSGAAGQYYVAVTDAHGDSLNSSNVTLTIESPFSCDTAPANLVSWWPGEGNILDNAGGNNGVPTSAVSYATGLVGEAFSFNGLNQNVRVPDAPNLRFTNAMSIEAWIYPTQSQNQEMSAVLSKYYGVEVLNQSAYALMLNANSTLALSLSQNGVATNGAQLVSTGSIPQNSWTHVAATYDGATISLYINGSLDSTLAYSGGIYPGTNDLIIGGIGGGQLGGFVSSFNGLIDEIAVYNRSLSAAEVQTIYFASILGKCAVSLPPSIYVQPAGQRVSAGTTASLKAAVSGSPSLALQWQFNGASLAGATNLTLTLTNVTPAVAGNYSLFASNSINTALSSNALLQVNLVNIFANGRLLNNSQNAFTNSVTISMTNYFTNGPIYYTLNGTTPSASSALYNGSFLLNSNATIQALGYSADLQQSALTLPLSVGIPPEFTLSATTPGGGKITLNPTNISEVVNTVVTLTATPSNGWTFLQWLGDAAGTNASTFVTMDRTKSVQAIFGTAVSNVVAGGSGSIVFNPPGGFYPFGTILQASAIPQTGNAFVLWGDSASGTANPLAFPVTNANPAISALFVGLGGGEVSLAVIPVGHGTVSVNPQDNSYASGFTVTVTATPAANHAFLGWSGGAGGTNNPLTIQLNQSEIIYANFTTNNSLLIHPVTPPGTADGVAVDLLGEFGTHYRLDTSSNLVNWSNLYDLTNYVGTIHYIDAGASNLNHRFYHATILP